LIRGTVYVRVLLAANADSLLQTAPQEPYNFYTEWRLAPLTSNRVASLLFGGWQVSVFSAQGGLPANITNTASGNAVDRPDAVRVIR
jgi:hypothetical protein